MIATIYLETSEHIVPSRKVEIFGNFTKNPWQDRIPCKYDPNFNCFKADKVKIMIGHQFKFVVHDNETFIISNRYPTVEDGSGNFNNVYDS